MGTAAFVALLMTLCNKSFSATQFALLSALSAVGRVYVGPVAGWFVELHGWPLFYLFSIVAAVPGLLLLVACRKTLEYTQTTGEFSRRTRFARAYKLASQSLLVGCILIALWLLGLAAESLSGFSADVIMAWLLNIGLLLSLFGILLGAGLDYRSQRDLQQVI